MANPPNARNPYLVTRALKTFMLASVLAAVASQLATTIDAIVVSNLIGPDAMSAVNLIIPVMTLYTAIAILIGIGCSIVAAKAIGRRDSNGANSLFTAGMGVTLAVSVLLGLVTYLFAPGIVQLLSQGHPEIRGYALTYLQVMAFGIPGMMAGLTLQNFVKTDGNPRIVMYAVISGSVLNLVLDILFIKAFGWGIAGSAWATVINYMLGIAICLFHFRNPNCSLRWRIERSKFAHFVRTGSLQGFPMCINTLMLALCIYLINTIVLAAQGPAGMYAWSICLQLFMIMQMVLTGIGSSIYAIGGILAGENDMEGLAILNRKAMTYVGVILAAVTICVLIFPGFFGRLFGSGGNDSDSLLHAALRVYSLMLLPYSLTAVLRSTYQILGRFMLSLTLSIGQLIIMVAGVWILAAINKNALWWGFPISGYSLIVGLGIYTWFIHRSRPQFRPVTLIPENETVPSLNISVRMDTEDAREALKEIDGFLKRQNVDSHTAFAVKLSCEELINNIVQYAVDKKPKNHFFDLHIRCEEEGIKVLLKDDGQPFNPANAEHTGLGLRLVEGVASDIGYKYMYDQNMVTLSFQRN